MDPQTNFLTLAKYYEELKDKLNQTRESLDLAMKALGAESYVQDSETLAVYKIVKPSGIFVAFRDLDYKRTSLEGEKGGGPSVLSKKEAEEKGFYLKR